MPVLLAMPMLVVRRPEQWLLLEGNLIERQLIEVTKEIFNLRAMVMNLLMEVI